MFAWVCARCLLSLLSGDAAAADEALLILRVCLKGFLLHLSCVIIALC